MNAEGYPDPTADKAIKRADKAPEQVSELIRTIKPWQLWPVTT